MSHYTIHQDDDTSSPVHTYRWSLLKDGTVIGELYSQADAETIRAALNGEPQRALIEQWRAESGSWEPGIGSGLAMCADELEASIAQQDTRQPTAEQER